MREKIQNTLKITCPDLDLTTVSNIEFYVKQPNFFGCYTPTVVSANEMVVTIPFADHPEVFVEKYTNGPESYGIQLNLKTPFYYDVDSDGELNEVVVCGSVTDDLIYVEHNIYIDGECYEQSSYDNDDYMPDDAVQITAYEIFTPRLIHLADGRNYLFIENLEDSDFRTNTVYELTDGTVKMVQTLYSSLYTEWSDSEECILRQALTDPYNFRMDTRTWVIGTHDGYQTYYIGEEGYSYTNEDYYTFAPNIIFTTLMDFELKLVDEYGNAGDAIAVKAGEELTYYRTDASLFADFILNDGRIARAELQWDEGTCYIDGIYVEDLFEGVVFAG